MACVPRGIGTTSSGWVSDVITDALGRTPDWLLKANSRDSAYTATYNDVADRIPRKTPSG